MKNILKLIVTERELGTVCGMSDNGADALEDLPILKPDIVIVDLLMEGMDGISFVTYNTRPNAMTMGKLGSVEDGGVMEMDCADWHLETIQEKNLPVEAKIFNHGCRTHKK